MSGYASYVWSAFFVTLVVFIVLYISSKARLKKALKTNDTLCHSKPSSKLRLSLMDDVKKLR
ncbi:MAG: heme exporter protein CcmD [Ostreibacterium sp.]